MYVGKLPEGNYAKAICPQCEPNAQPPFFKSPCYQHATKRVVTVEQAASALAVIYGAPGLEKA